jgi:hypothetical protein
VNDIEPLKETVRAFYNADIDFVLIGGLALVAQSGNYITDDTDVSYRGDAINTERLVSLLTRIEAVSEKNRTPPVSLEMLEQETRCTFVTTLGQVTVLRETAGISSFAELKERANLMDFGGFIVRVASIDDLITMKRAANRPKDQAHIYELLALKKLIAEQEAEAASENAPDKEQYAGN